MKESFAHLMSLPYAMTQTVMLVNNIILFMLLRINRGISHSLTRPKYFLTDADA